jgi:hypothetical protein
MIKFRTWYNNEIEQIEVRGETEHTIIRMNGNREHKRSLNKTGTNYFDTWEEAHDFLVRRTKQDINSLTIQLRNEERILKEIEEMKPPC